MGVVRNIRRFEGAQADGQLPVNRGAAKSRGRKQPSESIIAFSRGTFDLTVFQCEMSLKEGEQMLRIVHLELIRAFLEGSKEIGFEAASASELHEWTKRFLCDQEYASPGRASKGPVKRYIGKVTGRSRAPSVTPRRHQAQRRSQYRLPKPTAVAASSVPVGSTLASGLFMSYRA